MSEIWRDIRIRLGLDAKALQEAQQGTRTLEERIEQLGKTTQTTGRRAEDALKPLRRVSATPRPAYESDVDEVRAEIAMTRAQRARRAVTSSIGRFRQYAQERNLFSGGAGSPLRDAMEAASASKVQALEGDLVTLQDRFVAVGKGAGQFSGVLTSLGASFPIAVVAGAALATAIAVFNLRAEEASKRFKKITENLTKQLELQERLRQAESGTSRQIEETVQTTAQSRELVLQAAREVLKEAGTSEKVLPEIIKSIQIAANQTATRQMQGSRQRFEEVRAAEIAAAIAALSESEVVSALADLSTRRRGVLDTGTLEELGIGDFTRGAEAAQEVLKQLTDLNEVLAVTLKAAPVVGEREERERRIAATRARINLVSEARSAGESGDTESLDRDRVNLKQQITDLQAYIEELRGMGEQHQEVAEAIRESNAELENLTERQALLESITAPLVAKREAEAKALEALRAEMERVTKAVENDADARRQAASVSSDQIAERKREIAAEIDTARRVIARLQMQAKGNAEVEAAVAEYTKKIEDLRGENRTANAHHRTACAPA